MVQSKWNDAEAAKCNGDLLALRVYTSRIMSRLFALLALRGQVCKFHLIAYWIHAERF